MIDTNVIILLHRRNISLFRIYSLAEYLLILISYFWSNLWKYIFYDWFLIFEKKCHRVSNLSLLSEREINYLKLLYLWNAQLNKLKEYIQGTYTKSFNSCCNYLTKLEKSITFSKHLNPRWSIAVGKKKKKKKKKK